MKFLDQAKDLLTKNSSKITSNLDGVTKFVDSKTGGKYTDKINKVSATVEGKLGDLGSDDKIDLTDTDLADADLTDVIDTDAAADAVEEVAAEVTDPES